MEGKNRRERPNFPAVSMGDADEDLTDVFNSVDVDGSGSIDAGELG